MGERMKCVRVVRTAGMRVVHGFYAHIGKNCNEMELHIPQEKDMLLFCEKEVLTERDARQSALTPQHMEAVQTSASHDNVCARGGIVRKIQQCTYCAIGQLHGQ